MAKISINVFTLAVFGLLGCQTKPLATHPYESENLKITRLTEHTFIHTSFLNTEQYGKVPCNGMIVIDHHEAIVFDTPPNDDASLELINWLEAHANCEIKAVVATHFHVDCLGGLATFHQKKIPSYAHQLTIDLANSSQVHPPQNGFEKYFELNVGKKKVACEFLGEGHTRDNIVAYFPSEKVLFGGCLIKAEGSGKGNLTDANVAEWSKTVEKVKSKYGDAKIIIPGHGKAGGTELLDYTIGLFGVGE